MANADTASGRCQEPVDQEYHRWSSVPVETQVS